MAKGRVQREPTLGNVDSGAAGVLGGGLLGGLLGGVPGAVAGGLLGSRQIGGAIRDWLGRPGGMLDPTRGQYNWTMDPTAYAGGFTDLRSGINADLMNQFGFAPGGLGGNFWNQYMGGVGGVTGAAGALGTSLGGLPSAISGNLLTTGRNIGGTTGSLGNILGSLGSEGSMWARQLTGMTDPYTRAATQVAGLAPGGMTSDVMNQFMSFAPGLANLAMGQTSPLEAGLRGTQQRMTRDIMSDVAGQLAPMGAQYSSALGDIAGARIGEANADLMNQVMQQQLGLTGSLWGGALGELGAGARTGYGLAQQGYLGAGQLGLAGRQAGLEGLLGLGGLQTQGLLGIGGLQQGLGQLGLQGLLGGQEALNQGYLGIGGLYGNLAGLGAQGAMGMAGNLMNLPSEFVAPDIAYNPTWMEQYGMPIGQGLLGLGGTLGSAALTSGLIPV